MIGQQKLKTLVRSFNRETFPQVVLLCGDSGCGKHTFINEYVLPILSPEIVDDITEKVSFDFFMDAELDIRNILYVIDIRKLTEEKQNVLLKFLEEPPETCHIVLLSKYQTDVIPTVLNRCYTCIFEPYSNEELIKYCAEHNIRQDLIDIANTIGKLEAYKEYGVDEVKRICETLLMSAKSAQLSNLFTLTDRINWGNGTGYDVDFFFLVMLNVCFDLYRQRIINVGVFTLTEKTFSNIFSINNIDKKRMFDKYLIDLKYERY